MVITGRVCTSACVCVCVCAHQAQIHGFLHTTKGVRERVTVRNYYLQAATTKHILLSCLQYVAETLSAFRQQSIFSGSHYAQLKITSSKYMEHVYKTWWDCADKAAMHSAALPYARSTYLNIWLCTQSEHWSTVQWSLTSVSLWVDNKSMTHPDFSISFPCREILRSSLLSSLWVRGSNRNRFIPNG